MIIIDWNIFKEALIIVYCIFSFFIGVFTCVSILDRTFILKYYHLIFPFSFILSLLMALGLGFFFLMGTIGVIVFKFLSSPIFTKKEECKKEIEPTETKEVELKLIKQYK